MKALAHYVIYASSFVSEFPKLDDCKKYDKNDEVW